MYLMVLVYTNHNTFLCIYDVHKIIVSTFSYTFCVVAIYPGMS